MICEKWDEGWSINRAKCRPLDFFRRKNWSLLTCSRAVWSCTAAESSNFLFPKDLGVHVLFHQTKMAAHFNGWFIREQDSMHKPVPAAEQPEIWMEASIISAFFMHSDWVTGRSYKDAKTIPTTMRQEAHLGWSEGWHYPYYKPNYTYTHDSKGVDGRNPANHLGCQKPL